MELIRELEKKEAKKNMVFEACPSFTLFQISCLFELDLSGSSNFLVMI